jgi:hypothetical protein
MIPPNAKETGREKKRINGITCEVTYYEVPLSGPIMNVITEDFYFSVPLKGRRAGRATSSSFVAANSGDAENA